ncbi:plastid-specific 50S ribosomal protein 6 [Prunus dulcis]|uniref:Plastid-specific 50S ribosomal protein 6 n=1 Tax=Prunus dulcis TaxID=3755 RepID=A0A4Y1QVX0_PRUDU|nr:plastid-specific 50S ribosomal protein 6 [Prunus dulcis]
MSNPSATASFGVPKTSPWRGSVGGGTGLMIECSSRPQKKATAHHRKTRLAKRSHGRETQAHCVHSSASSPCRLDIVSSADEASSSSPQEPPTTE